MQDKELIAQEWIIRFDGEIKQNKKIISEEKKTKIIKKNNLS